MKILFYNTLFKNLIINQTYITNNELILDIIDFIIINGNNKIINLINIRKRVHE